MSSATRPAARVSRLQRDILSRLLFHELARPADEAVAMVVKRLRATGSKTPAGRSIFSRSLTRLARRGLVTCYNFRGIGHGPVTGQLTIDRGRDRGSRVTHLALTDAGRALARRLADAATPPPEPAPPLGASPIRTEEPRSEPQAAPKPAVPIALPTANFRKCSWCESEAMANDAYCRNCRRSVSICAGVPVPPECYE